MPKCCVRFCFNSSTKNQENGLVFFLWPKNENVIDKWLQEFAVHCNVTGYSQQHFKITRSMRICNLHFEENCFTKETNKLLKDAVPTIFKFTAKPKDVPRHSQVKTTSTAFTRSATQHSVSTLDKLSGTFTQNQDLRLRGNNRLQQQCVNNHSCNPIAYHSPESNDKLTEISCTNNLNDQISFIGCYMPKDLSNEVATVSTLQSLAIIL